ncbi:MAG TPA: glycosyltransferase 87 family protein [Acidimicrobiales bacterium]|nr:glycosyltransferase 87 family protein [Acidimicrobiales bacterium]
MRPLVAGGFVVAGAAGIALSAAVGTGGDIVATRWSILVRLAAWSVVWVVAVACALRLPRRVALGGILLAGVALRLAAIVGPPVLSDDFYRQAWDGRVQAAGINPYRYAPTAPELRSLREPWLWPDDAGCASLGRPPECTFINRPTVRTIYPPLAQAWFAAVYRVSGIDSRHKAWQVAGLAGDLVLVGLLPLALRAWGRDERWTALYALSPFPVVEVVNNGHLDGLAAVFVVAALLAAARRRPAWAGALVGGAVLIKLYPAVLLVGLAGLVGAAGTLRRRWSPLIRGTVAAGAVVAVGYLPHVIGVGAKVLGYLPGYLREENYDGGGRYLLAGILGLPGGPTAALAAAGLGAVLVWVLARRPDVPRAWAALLGGLLLATTPVQPWYAVTLVAVATVAALPAWPLLAAAAYPYFFAVILAARHTVAIGRISYGLAFVAVLVGAARRRARRPPSPDHTPEIPAAPVA